MSSIFHSCCLIFVILVYDCFSCSVVLGAPSEDVPRIVLIGDSILDNAYWNNVGSRPTGQVLVEMLNGSGAINGARVLIDDRSTEEASTESILNALNGDGRISVPDHILSIPESYRERRQRNGVGYDCPEPGSARIPEYCEIIFNNEEGVTAQQRVSTTVNIRSDIRGSFVFISAGGNDLLLNGTFNFVTIIENLKKIAAIYRRLGAKKVFYIIPYTMGYTMGSSDQYRTLVERGTYTIFSAMINFCRFAVKHLYVNYLKPNHYDDLIDLSDFNHTHRHARGWIPEPTPEGARELAVRIAAMFQAYSSETTEENQATGFSASPYPSHSFFSHHFFK